jgi:hypothetical protein
MAARPGTISAERERGQQGADLPNLMRMLMNT